MIRMIQSKSAGHAKAYFSDALAKSDYYTSDQELAGFWQGRLAERLGVSGLTDKETFFALCENLHPTKGGHLTPRIKEDRTTGYDINFHCPKSVSVLHVLSSDDHILKAFQASVTETMQCLESDIKTRIRKGGTYDDRQTGELIWSHFTHQTARPVEGFLPDPHLHSHCFVFNATWDEQEQKFKAGQFRDIKRDMPYYQARFQKTLADKLEGLGYAIKLTGKSFEIEGVPQKVVDLFCKRTDEIGRIAKEKGITDAKELGELGARTRSKKQKGHSMAELTEAWKSQIKALGTDNKMEVDKIIRYVKDKPQVSIDAQNCIDHAALHWFERVSVLPERKLLETAFRQGLGCSQVSVKDILNCFKTDKRFIQVNENGRTVVTTKEVLAEEERMVKLARAGQGKMAPLYEKAPDLNLNGQQAAAVSHILTTPHRVSIVRGAAGTGKTTLMREASQKIKEAGKEITVIAPTAEASRGVLRTEGFAQAETVSKFLIDPKMQAATKGQVIWVDEAGLLGTKDMKALLEIATQNDAQLILGGDTRQHASVIRGDALRVLNTVAGIKSAEVSKIYRQQTKEYREAVEDLAQGKVKEGFEKLDDMGAIKEIDPMQSNKALVDDYMETLKKGKSALVISPTHAQGDEVTTEIRARMRESGLIGKKEINVSRLVNLNMTEAEKKDTRNFKEGQVIQFEQNMKDIQRGSVWEVAQVENKTVTIVNDKGQEQLLPIHRSKDFGVYRQDELQLSKGDKIRITHGAFDENNRRLENGDLLNVLSVSKSGAVKLQNEKSKAIYTLDKDFGHLAHAHCITSYASQGKTIDEVFIYQPSVTFPATDAKQFYVSVSRGKEKAHIYTDDKEALLEHAAELGERLSAIELVSKTRTHKDFVQQLERQENEKHREHTIEKEKQSEYEPEI